MTNTLECLQIDLMCICPRPAYRASRYSRICQFPKRSLSREERGQRRHERGCTSVSVAQVLLNARCLDCWNLVWEGQRGEERSLAGTNWEKRRYNNLYGGLVHFTSLTVVQCRGGRNLSHFSSTVSTAKHTTHHSVIRSESSTLKGSSLVDWKKKNPQL